MFGNMYCVTRTPSLPTTTDVDVLNSGCGRLFGVQCSQCSKPLEYGGLRISADVAFVVVTLASVAGSLFPVSRFPVGCAVKFAIPPREKIVRFIMKTLPISPLGRVFAGCSL